MKLGTSYWVDGALRRFAAVVLIAAATLIFPIRNADPINTPELKADANEAPNVSAQAKISAGYHNTCAITTDGGLKCWGYNDNPNRIVTSAATNVITEPTDRSGLTSGVASVSVFGGIGMCVVTVDGGAKCWGTNGTGKVGNGSTSDVFVPTNVDGLTSGVAQIATGGGHACALLTSGAVKCWGDRSRGQLGDGSAASGVGQASPVQVSGLESGVLAIAAGDEHTCAILSADGSVKCWGATTYGQVGDGTSGNFTYRLAPVFVLASGTDQNVDRRLTGAVALTAGDTHTCAVTSSGGVMCWGRSDYGQLGDGTTSTRLNPVNVLDETGAASLSGISAVTAGDQHTCALTTSGGVKCWGENTSGPLGDGTGVRKSLPVNVLSAGTDQSRNRLTGVVAITAGLGHTCGLLSDNSLMCWGGNSNGQLGDASITQRLNPVTVAGGFSFGVDSSAPTLSSAAVNSAGKQLILQFNEQISLTTASASSFAVTVAGASRSVSSVAVAGSTVVLTLSSAVTMGQSVTVAYTDPSGGDDANAVQDASGNDAASFNTSSGAVTVANHVVGSQQLLSMGFSHTCAVTPAGGVKCWGANSNGALGNGNATTTNSATPVDVTGLSDVVAISSGWFHTCARTSSGGVKCWGYGPALGDGTSLNRSTPVNVLTAGTDQSQNILTGVAAITSGGRSTCALMINGGVKCWGFNNTNQLGNGTTTNATWPVDVQTSATDSSPLVGVTAVAAGFDEGSNGASHACALMVTGGVKCWGDNTFGQLGDGTSTSRSTPVNVLTSGTVQTQNLLSGITAISVGKHTTCAVTSTNSAKCWGSNGSSQIGDGTTTNPRLYPVDVLASGTPSSSPVVLTGISAIDVGYHHTCAVLASGGVKCWGNTYNGDGPLANRTTPVNVLNPLTDQNQNLLSGATAVSVGEYFTCVLLDSGAIKCWGSNGSGQIGDGTTTNPRLYPVDVVGGFSFGSDATAPTFVSAAVNTAGTKVILTYSEALSATTASASAFAVVVGGSSRSVSSVAVSGSTVELTLASAVATGESVTVAYTDPSGSNDANAVQDSAGNDAASLSATSVTNNADSVSPSFVSAATNSTGDQVTLTFGEALSSTTAAAGAFSVVVNGTAVTPSSVTVSGSTVVLAVSPAIQRGDTVTFAYTDPTNGNDANAVQDSIGNDVGSISTTSVTNSSTVDTRTPTFVSAATSADGTTITLTYSESLSATTASASAFSVVVGGSARSVSSAVVSGSTVVLTLASAVGSGQSVTVAYTDPSGSNDANAVQDSAGNDAASLSATSVTNNSTADQSVPTFVSAATSADGTTITLTYSEALSATTASASAFSVVVGGSSRSVSSAVVSGSTVVLTLASAVGSGQSVTVAYTDPSGSNDANAVQDSAGNDAATLAATAVTNNVPTPTTTTVPASGGGASGGPSSGTTTSTTTTSTTTTTSSTVPAVVPTTLGNITTTTISRPRRTTTTTSTTVARRPSSATSTSTATNSSSITSTTIARAATTTTVFKPLVPLAPVTTVTRSTSPSTSVSASSSTSSTIALASPSTLVSPVTTITQRTVTNLSQAEKALETAKQAATSDIASAQMALADLRLSVIDPKSALAVAVNDAIRIVERLKTNDASPEQIAKAEERVTELKTGIAEAKSISVEGILDAQRAVEAVLNNPQASAAEVADAVSAFTVARTPDLDDVAAVLSGESQDATLPIVIRGVVDDPRVGNVVFLDDAQSKAMEIVTVNNLAVRLQSNQGFNLTIASRDSKGSPIQLGTNGAIVVRHDNFISVSGEGFAANSVAKTWLFSSPRELGVLEVRADGSFAADHPIGKDVKVGLHTAQINGLSPDGEVRSVSLSIEVLPNEGPAPYDPLNQPRTVLTLVAELVALLGVVGATSGMGGVSGRKREEEDDERESAEVAEVSVAFGSVGVDRVRDRLPVLVVDVVDRVSVGASRGVVGLSPMLARVFGDGVYLRSILGVLWLVLPFVGAGFGVGAASSSGFDAVMPSLFWLSALVVLGVFDAFSGFVAALVFGLAVGFGGGVVSGDSVRGLLGVWVFCFAAPLIAGAVRPFRRVRGGSAQIVWDRCVDFVLIVLFGAWVAGSMYSALPGLTGFNSLSAGYVNHVRVVVLVALAVRFVLENFAVAVTPVRLKALTREPLPEPTLLQQIFSAIVRTGVYMFVAVVFIGNNWALWLGGVLYLVPKLVGLGADKLPDMRTVHRYLPRGIFKVVLMLFVAKWWGSIVAAQVDNPADMIKFGFVLLGIPGLALGAVGWFARSSRPWPSTIVTKLLGTALLIIGVLVVLNIWEIL